MSDDIRVVFGEIIRDLGQMKPPQGDGIEEMIDLSIAYSPVMYAEPWVGFIGNTPCEAVKRDDEHYTVYYSYEDRRGRTQRGFRNVEKWEMVKMRAEYMRRRQCYYEHFPRFNYAEKEWIVQHFFGGFFFDPRNGKREVMGDIIREYEPPM